MVHFDWPWLFLALPAPLAAWRWLPPLPLVRAADALILPEHLQPEGVLATSTTPRRPSRPVLALAGVAWILLVLAAARPEWVGEPVEIPVNGRNLMLAVDLSGSMQTRDFAINGQAVDRLTIAKQVAAAFLRRRTGDRVGLILFGAAAYLQTPLTLDRESTARLLEEAVIGLAGKETAIGDAVGLGVKKIRETPANSRALILLTDGVSNAGVVAPLQAARLAAGESIRLYTIGVGADEMTVPTLFGARKVNPSAELDEKTLKEMADLTQGRYFRARESAQLEEIYRQLDQLEPVSGENRTHRPIRALFVWPLAISLLLAGGLLLWRYRRGDAAT